jgi:hypothetical protein
MYVFPPTPGLPVRVYRDGDALTYAWSRFGRVYQGIEFLVWAATLR